MDHPNPPRSDPAQALAAGAGGAVPAMVGPAGDARAEVDPALDATAGLALRASRPSRAALAWVLAAHGVVFLLGLGAVLAWALQPAVVRPAGGLVEGLGLDQLLTGAGEASVQGAAADGPAGVADGLWPVLLPESLGVAGLLAMVLSVVLAPASVGLVHLVWQTRMARQELRSILAQLRSLGEQAALSDDARRVLHRTRERTLLRRAIEEDIAAEDWDAALVLAGELADRFGYRQDAEDFRRRIDRARRATVEQQLAHAIARLDDLVLQRQWDEARREAERIARAFPDAPRAQAAPERVGRELARFKAELERQFLEAAEDDRVEEAMELLKRLDQHLTEDEAAPFREVARGVIGKARDNMGAKFKLAVRDKRWVEAAALGERIIAEFPNSRMAAEVRELLDGIRERAAKMVASGTPGY
ncbi:MAG: hypothetical protein KatS3mg103_0791 [Phycisphaerales bacterium]|nr:MAG: hypothetical protein KatS3mg103_0791 [Phycisphaerales bacterium]